MCLGGVTLVLPLIAAAIFYDFHSTIFKHKDGDAYASWNGQTCNPKTILQPTTVSEIQNIVLAAAQNKTVVRVVGAGHSFSEGLLTDGIMVNLDKLDKLQSLDRDRGTVRVEGGMRLHELVAILAQHGMALPNLGHILEQSAAGAISTGTHGTGLEFPSLSGLVTRLELVDGKGNLVVASKENNTDIFNAARVSFGALGVIVSVEFSCVGLELVQRKEWNLPWVELKENITDFLNTNQRFQFWWIPHTSMGRAITINNIGSGNLEERRPAWLRWVQEQLMGKLFSLVLLSTCWYPSCWPTMMQKVFLTVMDSVDLVDVSPYALTGTYPDVYTEMEYFFTLQDGPAALDELMRAFNNQQIQASQATGSQDAGSTDGATKPVSGKVLYSNLPVCVRFVDKDDIWLSQNYGRQSFVISISNYRNDVNFVNLTSTLETIGKKYGARPHWGKVNSLTAQEYSEVFPKFKDFLRVRKQLDPDNVFVNDYVKRVLLKTD